MRQEREIDAWPAALSMVKQEQANFSFCYYYIAPAPFTQGIFFIFIKFVNSVNILCKLRYVNSRNQERTPQESAAFFLDEILNLCENHSKNVKNQWFRIYRQDSH